MKNWRRKIRPTPIFVSVFMLALFVVAMLVPVTAFSQGCPPNDTCDDGWRPVTIECWMMICDEPHGDGYCILCRKEEG